LKEFASALNGLATGWTVRNCFINVEEGFFMNATFGLRALSTALVGVLALYSAGCSKPADSAGIPAPGVTVGTEIDDSVVTTKVKSALLTDEAVKSYDLKVETRKGEVQLSGFVDNQSQMETAMSVTRGVEGVKNIDNRMSLKGGTTTVGNKVDDGIITTKVKAALLADASVKSLDIAVVTRKGEVQLSGFVNNQGQIDHAVEVAHTIEGVSSVGNQMSVKK
jgi:hyperosmotically inducible protein